MKMTTVYRLLPAFVLLVALCGCVDVNLGPLSGDSDPGPLSQVRLIGLTEITEKSDGTGVIDAYVDIDGYSDGEVSADKTFRFELYEYVARTPRHVGSRINIWPDFLVTKADQQYFKEHLKAYLFRLPIDFILPDSEKFVLQVTVSAESEDRGSDLFMLTKN